MSNVAAKAGEAKTALGKLIDRRKEEIEKRCAQLKRLQTPADEASQSTALDAVDEAQSYIDSVLA